jgi:hypothetical protein
MVPASLPTARLQALTLLMLAYGAASLIHFAHNAIFIDAYPSLPSWLSSTDVWVAWCAEASIGLAGYLLIRRGHALLGLALVCGWAALGFDGLTHYSLAPMSAHTLAMNATIWAEVCAAAALLTVAVIQLVRQAATRRASRARGATG